MTDDSKIIRNPTAPTAHELCTLTLEDILPLHLRRAAQRHHHAVATLARQAAIKAIKAKLRAEGTRLSEFAAREITMMAEDYLAQHRDQLTAEAKALIARSPYLARWRYPALPTNPCETLK